uniref:hypothetical protein n=1 Tax=Parerythrobacter lutipelagi TaxID=1964208 RepID=UPI0010F7666D|nr:hypothetical protein [Parerythrobacter lutipelagi]
MPAPNPSPQAKKLQTALSKVKALQDGARALKGQVEKLSKERDLQKAELDGAKKELLGHSKQVQALIEENRKLSENFENLKEERKALVLAANHANTGAKRAAERAEQAEKDLQAASARADKLAEEVDQLKKQIGAAEDKSEVVSAEKLGTLIDDLILRVESGATGLSLSGGRMKLQVGVADSKEGAAFVLPSATNPPEKSGPLHEMEISFDKLGGQSE